MIQTKAIGTEETIKMLGKVSKEVLEKVQREMNISAANVLADSQRTLSKEGKHVTGRLVSSGTVVTKPGNSIVRYNANYARFVEFGRRAGKWPPPTPIKDWVKKRGLASDPKEVKQIAFLIARKIGKNGVKPTPYLRPAFDREGMKLKKRLLKIL